MRRGRRVARRTAPFWHRDPGVPELPHAGRCRDNDLRTRRPQHSIVPLVDKSRPSASGTSACTPSHIRSRQMSRAVSLGFPWGSNVPDFELGYYGFRVGLLAENSPKPWVRPIPPSHASPAPAQRQPRGAWCRFSVTPRRQDTKRRANCKPILVVVKARLGCS